MSWPVGAVIPIDQAPSVRGLAATGEEGDQSLLDRRCPAAELRHDNPHWPVRSPADAANALLAHGECAWHCSTRVAAIIVSRNDYQFFRDRGRVGGDT